VAALELCLKTLYLIRHGQTTWNVEKRTQGRLDSPLTDAGKTQAETTGRLLKRIAQLDAMIASPSGRTRATADIVNTYLRAPLSYDAVLMERDWGAWTGLTIDDIEAKYRVSWKARESDSVGHRPPGGENFEDMIGRVQGFLDSLFERNRRQIALVTHSALSRAILAHFFKLAAGQLATVRHPNDLLYRLKFDALRIDVDYFVNGDGPREGLLHHTEK
jgi:probable phosphoglycerate mutase